MAQSLTDNEDPKVALMWAGSELFRDEVNAVMQCCMVSQTLAIRAYMENNFDVADTILSLTGEEIQPSLRKRHWQHQT